MWNVSLDLFTDVGVGIGAEVPGQMDSIIIILPSTVKGSGLGVFWGWFHSGCWLDLLLLPVMMFLLLLSLPTSELSGSSFPRLQARLLLLLSLPILFSPLGSFVGELDTLISPP